VLEVPTYDLTKPVVSKVEANVDRPTVTVNKPAASRIKSNVTVNQIVIADAYRGVSKRPENNIPLLNPQHVEEAKAYRAALHQQKKKQKLVQD
jgi:hypothetical protein